MRPGRADMLAQFSQMRWNRFGRAWKAAVRLEVDAFYTATQAFEQGRHDSTSGSANAVERYRKLPGLDRGSVDQWQRQHLVDVTAHGFAIGGERSDAVPPRPLHGIATGQFDH